MSVVYGRCKRYHDYRKTHTLKQTTEHYGVSSFTVKRLVNKYKEMLTNPKMKWLWEELEYRGD